MSKSKHTAKVPENQLSLFDFMGKESFHDERPLPLIVAEKWQFPLQHYEPNDQSTVYVFAVQDWIAGTAQTPSLKAASDFWTAMKRRIKALGIELPTPCKKLPYLASNGKNYQMDFADAKTLYRITQQMDTNTGLRNEILTYLSAAGAKLDDDRRNPEQAAYEQSKIADNRYTKRLRDFGYTDEQIPALLVERQEDVIVRNTFTDMLAKSIDGKPQYGAITNAEYTMFHRTAEQMSNQLGTKQVRENMHPIAKNFCRIAELTCMEKVKQLKRKLTSNEAYDIMHGIAMSLGVSVDWIQKQVGFDVVTGQPLIPTWNRERNMD